MTWAAFIASLLKFFNGLIDYIRSTKDQNYGRLKEREKIDANNKDALDRIDAADPDSVSDDEIRR